MDLPLKTDNNIDHNDSQNQPSLDDYFPNTFKITYLDNGNMDEQIYASTPSTVVFDKQ